MVNLSRPKLFMSRTRLIGVGLVNFDVDGRKRKLKMIFQLAFGFGFLISAL